MSVFYTEDNAFNNATIIALYFIVSSVMLLYMMVSFISITYDQHLYPPP